MNPTHWLISTQVLADFEMLEQGLEGLRPLQAFALREIHGSEVAGRRRVRKDLPKLSERAGDRRRFAENLFLCVRIGLDNVQRRLPGPLVEQMLPPHVISPRLFVHIVLRLLC